MAPLKQPFVGVMNADGERFPRPNSRGPIEAGTAESILGYYVGFPRPNSRGPIEANTRGPRTSEKLAVFHGLIAVAPLKLGGGRIV